MTTVAAVIVTIRAVMVAADARGRVLVRGHAMVDAVKAHGVAVMAVRIRAAVAAGQVGVRADDPTAGRVIAQRQVVVPTDRTPGRAQPMVTVEHRVSARIQTAAPPRVSQRITADRQQDARVRDVT